MKRLFPLLLSLLLPALVFAQQEHNRYLEAMELYDAGDYAEAARLLDEHYINHPDCPYTAYNTACCYALIGEADRALLYLDRAIELSIYSFIDDTDFDAIRDGDAFQQRIVKVLGLIEELQEKNWPPEVVPPNEPTGESGYPVVVMLHGYGGSPEPLLRDEIAGTFTERGDLFAAPYADEVRGPRAFVWSDIEGAEAGQRCYLWIGLEDDAERVESLREAAGVLEGAGVELRFVVEPGASHSLPKDTAGLFEDILTYLVE